MRINCNGLSEKAQEDRYNDYMKQIGIYAGTFDPIHKGHMAFADCAAKAAHLDMVIFMPEKSPRAKANASSLEQRLKWLEGALIDSKHKIYNSHHDRFTTHETLAELAALHPDSRLNFLVGSDVALTLARWQDIEQLVQTCQFVVGMRDGDDESEVKQVLARLHADYMIIKVPFPAVSSSHLRK